MDEDINDEFVIKNEKQFEDCKLDNAETINIPKTIDIELSEKILGIFCKVCKVLLFKFTLIIK
jgi:hypothetical protein